MNKPRSHGRMAFASVLAVLLLAVSAMTVISTGRNAAEGSRMGRLALESARAHLGARAGQALALSANRGGVEIDEIVVDPALPVISFEETSDQGVSEWVIRASSGEAVVTRTHTPF